MMHGKIGFGEGEAEIGWIEGQFLEVLIEFYLHGLMLLGFGVDKTELYGSALYLFGLMGGEL